MTVTTPLGQVLRDDDGLRLQFIRTYDVPVEDVWAALTEPGRVARWFGTWTGDPATGSIEVRMTAEEETSAQTVQILECQPPRRLAMNLPSPDGAWHLTLSLRDVNGLTTLEFTQRLTEPYDAGSIGPGWHFYLDRLAAVVAGGTVPDSWDDYYPSLQDAYALPR